MSRSKIGRHFYRAASKQKAPAERIIERYRTQLPLKLPHHKALESRELDDIHKIFKYFDSNGDYQLSSKEYHEFVKWSSGNTVNGPVSEVFKSIDVDGNSKISLPEFVEYAARRKASLPLKSELMKLFYKFDRNDDGYLNIEETRLVMLELGDQPDQMGFARAFARIDRDRDGLLDTDEFLDFVNSHSVRASLK